MKTFYLLLFGLSLALLVQAQVSKTVINTAGSLDTLLTASEFSSLNQLILQGTMDARDFKTIRDKMPRLSVLDMSGVKIMAFKDTISSFPVLQPANAIPPVTYNSDILYSLSQLGNLTSVILPPNLISIGYRSFSGCTGLTFMMIPNSVDTFRTEAFKGCTGIKSFVLPSSMSDIGPSAFEDCSSLDSIKIPIGITMIKPSTFEGCRSLKSVKIPNTFFSIGYGAFLDCIELSAIEIPASVKFIAQEAFSGCSSLKFVEIPPLVEKIESGTFFQCIALTSVTLPKSISSIGQTAFFGCRNLTSLSVNRFIPVDLTKSPSVFYDVNRSVCKLYVPYGSLGLYTQAAEWKEFAKIVEMPGFKLSQTTDTLEAISGSISSISLVSNTNWTIHSNQKWLNVFPTSGIGDQRLTFTADANLTDTLRTAIVTVSVAEIDSQTVVVSQLAMSVGVDKIDQSRVEFTCYPNPFREEISIELYNPKHENFTVEIYTLAGLRVKKLAHENSDEHLLLRWNGTNENGEKMAPGVYICKMNQKSRQIIFGGK